MALELVDKNPFTTETFGELNTDRPGFTFDPNLYIDWKKDFESNLPDFTLNLQPRFSSSFATMGSIPSGFSGGAGTPNNNFMDSFGNILMGIKSEGDKSLALGYGLKTVAAAGELFNDIVNYRFTRTNANLAASNTKKSVANQMLALDNQIQYYKNQITDKFAQTMSKNAVIMASKNLRVTAGNLLEQTKDAAYDATKDMRMLESNAELKKIALRSEAKQADVTKKLTKNLATANVIGSMAKLGLMVSGGMMAGVDYGNLFATASGSLNETVYGGK